MFHLLGTHWQHATMAMHRWTGLAFVITVIVYTYLGIRLRTAHSA